MKFMQMSEVSNEKIPLCRYIVNNATRDDQTKTRP